MKTITVRTSALIVTLSLLTALFVFYSYTFASAVDGEITSPEADQKLEVGDTLVLAASDNTAKDGEVQWAVREGTCDQGTGAVFGNVDGLSDDYTWEEGEFSATTSTAGWKTGKYCFVFNPDEGERLTQEFTLVEPEPTTGTLVVEKQVENSTSTPNMFSFTINGTGTTTFPNNGIATFSDYATGTYAIAEVPVDDYTISFSEDCDSDGNITITAGATSTCVITNTYVEPTVGTGTLTIEKVVVGTSTATSSFSYSLDGGDGVAFETDTMTESIQVGTQFTVTETGEDNGRVTVNGATFDVTYSDDCKAKMVEDGRTCTITNTYKAPEVVEGEITSPEADQELEVGDTLELAATYTAAEEEVQWAVRFETCKPNTGTVFGNVDGLSDDFSWKDGEFSASTSTAGWEGGDYCFVFNPRQGDRLTQWFTLADPDDDNDEEKEDKDKKDDYKKDKKDDKADEKAFCKQGGWEELGFRNQGQCIRFVNTGQDSR